MQSTSLSAASGTARRVALVALGWTVFASVRIVLSLVASRTTRVDRMSVTYALSMAAAWTLFSLLIASWTRSIDRASWPIARKGGTHLLGIVLVCFADACWRQATLVALGAKITVPLYATALYYSDLNIAAYFAVLIVVRALALEDLLVAQSRRQLALRAQLAQARLDYLEAQLQPHFLFNSLGTITELAHEAPAAAARMLRQLATLLRFAVHEQGHAVTLRDELDALEPYLDIQRMRFSDWLTITYDISPAALTALVPRLTLQPLVENAIRHGLVGRTERGLIKIAASREGSRLRLAVHDDGVGLVSTSGSEGYGIGLRNMRRRLAAAYDDDFQLHLQSAHGGGAIAEIDLPITFSPIATGKDAESAGAVTLATGRLLQLFQQRPVISTIVAWTVWGVLWFQMSYGYMAMRHRLGEIRLPDMIRDHAIAVVLWAALTPLILGVARALPIARSSVRALVHIPIACLFGLLHVALWQSFMTVPEQLWAPNYVASMLWTVLLYAFLLGVAQYRQVATWFRERETGTARLEAELAEARMNAATIRFQPDVVLRALEELASRVHLDPARAESDLARLADDMRLALE